MKIKRIICVSGIMMILLAGCGHEHQWSDATCEEPKKCVECGETEGEPLSHNWLEATCTSPKTCNICGLEEGEALGHKWQEADFENPKTCSVCGEIEGDVLKTFVEENNIVFTNETSFTLPWVHDYTNMEGTEPKDYDGLRCEQGDCTISIDSVSYTEPDENGYKKIEIQYNQNYSFVDVADLNKVGGVKFNYRICMPAFSIGDLYTGLEYPSKSLFSSDEKYDNKIQLECGKNKYDIFYFVENESSVNKGDWEYISDTDLKRSMSGNMLIKVYLSIPKDYDGAILTISKAGKTEIDYELVNSKVEENIADKKLENILDEITADDIYCIRVSDLIENMGNKVDTINFSEEE